MTHDQYEHICSLRCGHDVKLFVTLFLNSNTCNNTSPERLFATASPNSFAAAFCLSPYSPALHRKTLPVPPVEPQAKPTLWASRNLHSVGRLQVPSIFFQLRHLPKSAKRISSALFEHIFCPGNDFETGNP